MSGGGFPRMHGWGGDKCICYGEPVWCDACVDAMRAGKQVRRTPPPPDTPASALTVTVSPAPDAAGIHPGIHLEPALSPAYETARAGFWQKTAAGKNEELKLARAELAQIAAQLADRENEVADLKAGVEVMRTLICELSQRPTLDQWKALMAQAAQPQRMADPEPESMPANALRWSV